MKIVKKISEKAKDRFGKKIPTIAFLGDSVTQGCFEIYKINETSIETVFDKNCAYHNYVEKILSVIYPDVYKRQAYNSLKEILEEEKVSWTR